MKQGRVIQGRSRVTRIARNGIYYITPFGTASSWQDMAGKKGMAELWRGYCYRSMQHTERLDSRSYSAESGWMTITKVGACKALRPFWRKSAPRARPVSCDQKADPPCQVCLALRSWSIDRGRSRRKRKFVKVREALCWKEEKRSLLHFFASTTYLNPHFLTTPSSPFPPFSFSLYPITFYLFISFSRHH